MNSITFYELAKSKTHTFYFLVGEVTVTLKYVTHILGQLVNGEPMTSRMDNNHSFLVENCLAIFGRQSGPHDHTLEKVNLAWVRQCRDTEPLDTQKSIERYIWTHILCLLEAVVTLDKLTSFANSNFLPLL
ncbi:hypothetical protein Ahy_A09g045415 [Arachis hypogaea]|uniref:Aminotransferase-like plant mobile domain-containing protein n=1 Tax=Arachis hypogaea TaxID=3818 RepID=A0A445BMB8_ARAHY|nr:hypothetical protein Ahy_A09g045415 [Arachis hypogaea]